MVVLHGHRHTDWIGMYGDVVLCSAPSAAFGCHSEPEHRGSFRVHQFGFANEGGILLKSSERVYVDLHPHVAAEAATRQDDLAA